MIYRFFNFLDKVVTKRSMIGMVVALSAIVFTPHILDNMAYINKHDDIYAIKAMKGKEMLGTGTGFHVQSDGGVTYLLTNKHVCGNDATHFVAENRLGYEFRTNIIKKDLKRDLCVLEKVSTAKPLRLAETYYSNDRAMVMGYPQNYGLVQTEGRVVKDMVWPSSIEGVSKEDCKVGGGVYEEKSVRVFLFLVKKTRCKYKYPVILTTIPVQGGSSGSPLMTEYGAGVLGIITWKESAHWGLAVKSYDIKKFINGVER